MNDFFSVLDDFEIQEFVTADDSDYVGSSFSMDSFNDSSSQVVPQEDLPYQQTAVDSVKTSGDDVTEDDVSAGTNYVWSGGTSPVTASNSANTYVSFSNYVRATNSDGFEYRIVSLKDIEGVSFAGDGTLDIDAATDVEITATGGVSLALNNGRVTNGSFLAGNGSITINTANADGGATTIAISDFSSEAVTFTSSNEDILTVETDQTTGTVTINDDNFYLNGTQLRFKNVDWDNSGDGVKASYEDGVLTVDASTLVPTAGETIQVTSAGGANIFIPPTGANAIKLLGTTYTYANATGEAYFMVNNEAVDGFVLSGTGDNITIEKANALSVYSDEDITTPLANVTGKNYTITQTGVDTFQANIYETSTIQINGSNTTLDFTISKATANTTAFRNAGGITITFDGDGEIQGVAGIARLTNTGDKMAVTGAAAYDETSGLPIITGNNRREYISIASGNFTLNGGTTQEIAVTTGDTVYSVYTGVELVTSEAAGTIVDGANNITYTYGGTGYFTADQNNNITGFIFNAANDYIVLPDDVVNFNVTYTSPTTGRQVAVPIPAAVNDADGYYRLTMSDTSGKFAISELSAGSSVNGITFAGTDGVVEFDSTGITGVKSTTGNVSFDAVGSALLANAGFKINDIALPAITTTEATYVFNGNRLETPATYYMFGTTNNYGNYTFANEEDQLVYFDVDANGNVTAIRALNGGSVQGDFTGTVTVNGQTIITNDSDLSVTGNAAGDDIVAVDGLVGDMVLTAAESGLRINGDTVVFAFGNTTTSVVATGDANGLTTVSGFHTGDVVAASDDSVAFEFVTTGGTDNFTVNGELYTVTGDTDGSIFITGAGDVKGLDEGASLKVTPAADVNVNEVAYTADEVNNGEQVIGFEKKNGTISSYVTDRTHPLFNLQTTPADIRNWLGLAYNTDQIFVESLGNNLDRSADTVSAEVILDGTDPESVATAMFNDLGGNLAIVSRIAQGTKNIILGKRGDAVIMMGEDEYGTVNIVGGEGNDTIFVGGRRDVEDAVVHGAGMTTNIDLSKGGVDKIHTYAAANANIVLNNYDEKSLAGVVLHDPEIPYIKDLAAAINEDLIVVDGDQIVAIDRDETRTGVDRKTRIKVNNTNTAHQSMVRLFGYKDNKDTDHLNQKAYSDDFGQLLGFTGVTGGTLDASDITESLVLIGNKDGNHSVGSYLKTGTADDTVFAGGMDTIDTGDGKDIIIMDDTADRKAATIIVGQGAGDAVQNLKSGFEGDIFDVTSYDGKLAYTFENGVLGIVDESSKSTLLANTDETGQFIKQRFINGSDTLYAAIAQEGGTITVTDSDDTVPNYFLANDGAIDFTGFSGDVGLDVDGEDLDYPSAINGVSASIGSAVNSLIGGSGTTIFKGGKGNETLVAGTGESSLYGGGGQNVLIGDTSSVKTGSVEFFNIGIHNGAQNSIVGFEFIENGGSNQATFDNLNLGLADGNEVSDIQANSDGSVSLVIKGGESGAFEKATIADAAGKEFLVDRGTNTETVAQIAAGVVTVNHDYVDFYAATDTNATVQIGNVTSAKVWLEAPDFSDGVEYVGDFTVIDARGSGAAVEMAGNNVANTIYGGEGNASMWGGAGNANDVMVGGSAHNEYYYEVGNGNDTILSAKDGDIIHLGMSLDQINFDGTEMSGNGIVVRFNDGGAGSLYIDGGADVSFSFDDGTNVRANRQTGQFE